MIKILLPQILAEIAGYKWYALVYAVAAVLFCGVIYLGTREFHWSYKKIRSFAILYNLNTNGITALALLLGRLVFIFCLVIFGGSNGLWDLLVLILMTILIAISSGNFKDLLQIITYAAIYVIAVMENMFIDFYRHVESNVIIFVVAVFFGLFAFLYSAYQTLVSYNNLLTKSALTDKKKFDEKFYEKEEK